MKNLSEMHKKADARGWIPPEGTQPYIVCAANRARGIIFCGSRHFSNAMISQMRSAGLSQKEMARAEQGFIDQYDRFWSREEALAIMKQTGQPIRYDDARSMTELFSENLY